MSETPSTFEKVSDWNCHFFYGVSQAHPSAVPALPQDNLQGLFSMVQVAGVIGTGALLDPHVVINAKGATVWNILFVQLFCDNRLALADVAQNRAAIFVPADSMRAAFSSHVNWPQTLLDQNPIGLASGHLFLLPFLLHRTQQGPAALTQSLKSPDGSLEVFGCGVFDSERPERLLQGLSALAQELGPA